MEDQGNPDDMLLRLLKDQGNASEQKLMLLEKSVFELSNQKSGVKLMRVSSSRISFKRECLKETMSLLTSQSPIEIDSPELVVESGSKERRKWSLKEDQILIGAWLNTSKDSVVSNEQKAGAFWKRIVQYYNASPYMVGTIPRELGQCKQRWARINEQVCKFVGCYDAALRAQKSGQNDDDVMRASQEYFFNDHSVKFSMEHAWRELRHDQKWCSTYVTKDGGSQKRKPVQAEVDRQAEVGEREERPVGVKAAKGVTKKKKSGREEELSQLHGVLEVKEKLARHKLLDRLLGKKESLSEMETSLKHS
ncbi:PREDICTED: glutathione S-transferase T3-like [Brassica oleracea var. oleracea]|uniref:glutathione S-transferase T3-like n=1 Tax=Brassica oleracea var. oleracea TaxID=109376 RepID=UPI0006A70A7A|nr:PREDICTED: glutathione S-transferase T3-like [Brassica oleracea var. oleracea]